MGSNKVVFRASYGLQERTCEQAKIIFKGAMSPTRAKNSLRNQGTLLV